MNTDSKLSSRVFNAAIEGQSNMVRLLLEKDTSGELHLLAFKEAAEAGHLATVNVFLNHNEEYAQSLLALEYCVLRRRMDVFDRLVDISSPTACERALRVGAGEGLITVVAKLFTHVEDTEVLAHALSLAAANDHLQIVKTLLPVVPFENRSEALAQAVLHHHILLAMYLIPLCDPKGNNSQALQYAVEEKLFDIADVLYPLSDPQTALNCMRENWTLQHEDGHLQYLEDRIESERLKKVLSSEVSSPRTTAKKM